MKKKEGKRVETITITTKNHETYSAVSNFFIDYYMTEANGEFVKVYLYLVRLLNSGRAVTVADIADHFNLTEKDICRAIKYWIKQGVLQLEYTADKILTGITMLPLTAKTSKEESESLLDMLGVTEEPVKKQPSASNKKKTEQADETAEEIESIKEETAIPKKVNYTARFMAEKQEDEDFGNLLYQTEIYFGKPLTQTDLRSLLYIYNELSFSPDLLEYLVEYCISIGKKSSRYIESVAIDWYKNGIRTVKEAKIASKNYNTIYVAVLKQLGIPRRVPTPTETQFIDTWYNTYAFNKNIIVEACKRAITSNPQSANFNYVNGILENWHKQNVRRLSDIEALDKKWAEEKKRKTTASKSTVNQFNNYQSSTSENVVNEFENLFLQETNQ